MGVLPDTQDAPL